MKEYKAGPGARFGDEDAKEIGVYIDTNFPDLVTPQMLLEDAKKRNSPLHKHFEWDDTKAAYEYRLWQAREILRGIVVIVDDNPIRAFHNVVIEQKGGGYVRLDDARNIPNLWEQVVDKALREVEAWTKRYEMYSDLSEIVVAVKNTRIKLTKKGATK